MTDFKPGDRVQVRGALHLHDAVVIAARGDAVWVEYPDSDTDLLHVGEVVKKPTHPIPSEPNTAWVDSQGDFWFVSPGGYLRCPADGVADPQEFAPFARLVPEGSEREAAIREVVEWLKGFTCIKCDQGIKQVERHFLSGVDQ